MSVMEDQRDSVSPTLAVAKPEVALEAEHETASASLFACHAAEDGEAEHDAQLAEAGGAAEAVPAKEKAKLAARLKVVWTLVVLMHACRVRADRFVTTLCRNSRWCRARLSQSCKAHTTKECSCGTMNVGCGCEGLDSR